MSYAEELSIKVTAQDEASARLKDVKRELKSLEQQQREAAKTLYDTGSKEAAADVDRLSKSIKNLRDEQKRTAAEAAKLNREIAKLSTTRLQRTGDWLVKHQKDIQRAGIVGSAAMVLFARSSIKAFAEAEKYQTQLNTAYAKFPGLADVSIDRMRSLNTELMNLTGADDDALAGAEALLARFNLTGTEIERLIPLVNDYSIATGTDLVGSAEVIGKALLGNARALKALGIDYKATGDRATDLAAIQDALREKVGGAGEAFGKTTAGQLAIANKTYENLREEVGAALVPALQALLAILKPVIAIFTAMPGPLKQAVLAVGALSLAAMIAVPRIIALRAAMAQAGIGGGKFTKALSSLSGAMMGPLGIAVAAAGAGLALWMQYTMNAKARTDQLTGSVDTLTGKLTEAGAQSIAEVLVGEIDPAHWEQMDRLGIGLDEAMRAIQGTEEQMTAYIDAVNKADSQLARYGITSQVVTNNVYDWWLATNRATEAARLMGKAIPGMGAGLEDVGDDADDAANNIDRLTAATRRLMGIIDRKQALQNYRRLVREAGSTAGKKGGRAAAEEALTGYETALSTFKPGSKAAAQFTLNEVDRLAALTKGAGFSKSYTAKLLEGLEQSRIEAERIVNTIANLDGKTITATIVSKLQTRGMDPSKFAAGGYVAGPGTGTSDSIPALLSNGEYVIRAAAVDRIGLGALDRLNHADKGPLPPIVSAPAITLSAPAGRDAPLVGSMTVVANTPLDMQRELAALDRRRDRDRRARTARAGRR